MSLKDAVFECVEGSLSPDGNVRKGAEDRLKALEVTDKFGVFLLEMMLGNGYAQPVRQLASILLRQYVESHWSVNSDKFIPPEPSEEVKQIIRHLAPQGLQDSNSKIRNSTASVISSIAHYDWPEFWPNLFDILIAFLRIPEGVKGAMRVLTEFSKEFTDDHIAKLAPFLLPELFEILQNKYTHSVQVKTSAVQVFRTCIQLICSYSEIDKSAMKKLLDPYFTNFLNVLVECLQEKNLNFSNHGLRKEVVKTISHLMKKVPRKMIAFLPHLLSPIETILVSSVDIFRDKFLGKSDEEETIDSEGEDIGIESVIFAIFELIVTLIEAPPYTYARQIVKNGMNDLIYYTIFYMQLPEDRIESWRSDVSSFAIDEDENSAAYSLRICAQDFLSLACEEFPFECLIALQFAINRLLSEGFVSNWKLQEASLFAVASLGNRIAQVNSQDPNGQVKFDIQGFIENIVIPLLNSPNKNNVLLMGRCLVLGSSFSNVINPVLTRQFIHCSAESMTPDKDPILRVLAAKALFNFVDIAKKEISIKACLLEEVLPNAIDSLINFGLSQSVEILSIVLDAVVGILDLDKNFTASIGSKITTLAIACFVKFHGDPMISPTVDEIVKGLCSNEECLPSVQERFTPTLVSVINSRQESVCGAQGVALDILTTIVRSSPVPLGLYMMNDAFPAVIACVNTTDDHTVLQNGGECLRAFTAVSPYQVRDYRDVNGVSGLSYVVQVACRLLDPMTSEFSASLVGKLVTTLICKTGDQLGDQLEHLLRAVLSKLQSADTLSVIQNLCMVYAHLFNVQMDAALKFLDTLPGPTGQSALHFVMSEWMSRQHLFFGQFDRKVSSMAMCKLLSHGVTSNDPRLSAITVKGDLIVDSGAPVMTRSKRGNEQWTTIPLLVKMFKLLVNELSGFLPELPEEDYETLSEEEEEENEAGNGNPIGNALLQDPNLDDEDLYDDEEGVGFLEDDDILLDPQYEVNLEEFLKEFLKSFSAQPVYPQYAQHLTKVEIDVLVKYGMPLSS